MERRWSLAEDKGLTWYPIVGPLPPVGEMQRRTMQGHDFVIARSVDGYTAFNAACPHASAALVEGDLRSHYVICPLHNYRFALADGRCLKPKDGPRLRLYQVNVRDGQLWVGLPSRGGEAGGARAAEGL